MTDIEEVKVRKRRGSQEIRRLVTEFQASGLRQVEFCKSHGLALSTLQRGLKSFLLQAVTQRCLEIRIDLEKHHGKQK